MTRTVWLATIILAALVVSLTAGQAAEKKSDGKYSYTAPAPKAAQPSAKGSSSSGKYTYEAPGREQSPANSPSAPGTYQAPGRGQNPANSPSVPGKYTYQPPRPGNGPANSPSSYYGNGQDPGRKYEPERHYGDGYQRPPGHGYQPPQHGYYPPPHRPSYPYPVYVPVPTTTVYYHYYTAPQRELYYPQECDLPVLSKCDIYAADGTYLGLVARAPEREDCIANTRGRFGSQYSATSIFNPNSPYGDPNSPLSCWNEYTDTPPRLFYNGAFRSYLTANRSLQPRIDPWWLVNVYLNRGAW